MSNCHFFPSASLFQGRGLGGKPFPLDQCLWILCQNWRGRGVKVEWVCQLQGGGGGNEPKSNHAAKKVRQ